MSRCFARHNIIQIFSISLEILNLVLAEGSKTELKKLYGVPREGVSFSAGE